MWSVVHFTKDDSVEAVPSFWIDKNKCAWPNKNPKLFIKRRVIPNKFDFEFLDARKLGKDTDDILETKKKTIAAQDTSNLSSANENYDDVMLTRKQKIKIKSLKKQEFNQKEKSKALWDVESENGHNSSDEPVSDEDPFYSPGFKTIVPETPSSIIKYNENESKLAYSHPGSYKRALDFGNKCQSSSPKPKFSKVFGKEICKLYHSEPNVIDTTASPFKVTTIVNPTAVENTGQIDILNKINRTTLNIWYEIKSLNERLEKIESSMLSKNFTEIDGLAVSDEFQEIIGKLPLGTEEQLADFEYKLVDHGIKNKMVTELSRLVRPTSLPSTVRAMLRFLFMDSILVNYSYKGQKKKKIFSTLNACSLIFDSLKKIDRFKNSNAIDMEGPIKIFIAGAKFRIKDKEHNSLIH